MSIKSSNKSSEINTTLVTFLLDRTGSMASIKDDTIGGFNTYLQTLKEATTPILFTFLQFDSMSVDKVCVKTPVASVQELNSSTFQPRASTPLIDAAYETIKAVEASEESKTSKVVICIQTDGQENASTKHTWNELNALIKEKSDLGWQFNFMGAGIDAYQQASRMGISAASTMSYDSKDRVATRAAFAAGATNAVMFGSGMAKNTSYNVNQKVAAKDAFDPSINIGITIKKPTPTSPPSLVDKLEL